MKGSPADRRRSLGRARVRRHEEQAWARRSGQVFTHRVDPKQLRAEQVLRALVREPELLELIKQEDAGIAALIRESLERVASSCD
jgi:hypothetical protein